MSNAERQARYRARRAAAMSPVATRPRRASDRRSRPRRWRDAIDELLALQATYADWLAALPEVCAKAPPPTRSKPSSRSTSPPSPTANHHAAMDAIKQHRRQQKTQTLDPDFAYVT